MSAPAAPPQLQTRKPTGIVPWPLILVEGEEKVGKTIAGVVLSASPRVGRTIWIDLGEGSADEYLKWPGARHEIVIHDGTYASILGQIRAAKAEAEQAAQAGEPPMVLVIDTISDLWDGLKAWTNSRARDRLRRKGNKVGDDDEVDVGMDLWNDSGERHKTVMTELQKFPGIAVVIARGSEVTAVENGRPVNNKRVWRVEGHRTLASKVTVWVRMEREEAPVIVGARSVHAGIRPGLDKPKPIRGKAADANMLDWLVFDFLKCDPATAQVRDLQHTTGGELLAEEQVGAPAAQQRPAGQSAARQTVHPDAPLVRKFAAAIAEADSIGRLADARTSVDVKEKSGALTGGGAAHVRSLIVGRRRELGFASEKTTLHLLDLLKARHVTDPDEQLIVATRLSDRQDLESVLALTEAEALAVTAKVRAAGPDVDLLTGDPLPPGVDPASVAPIDEGQAPAAGPEQGQAPADGNGPAA